MGNILDDLTGGKFSLKQEAKEIIKSQETYEVFIQFDTDSPKQLYKDVPIGTPFVLRLDGPGDNSRITITDQETGKKFSIFIK